MIDRYRTHDRGEVRRIGLIIIRLNKDGIIRRQGLARARYRPTLELIIGQRQGYQGDLLTLHVHVILSLAQYVYGTSCCPCSGD